MTATRASDDLLSLREERSWETADPSSAELIVLLISG